MSSLRALETLRALIALATNASTPEHEAAAAALQAVRRIQKHDLLSLEAIRSARVDAADERAYADAERARADAASRSYVTIRVHLMVLSESPQAYRFARLRADFRTQGMPATAWIRKRVLHRVVDASPDIAKVYASVGRRIVEALVVPQEAAASVRASLTIPGDPG